jgi:hypothetical protein
MAFRAAEFLAGSAAAGRSSHMLALVVGCSSHAGHCWLWLLAVRLALALVAGCSSHAGSSCWLLISCWLCNALSLAAGCSSDAGAGC